MPKTTVPGSLNDKTIQFFEKQDDSKSICKLCNKILSGLRISNLRSHLEIKHKTEYDTCVRIGAHDESKYAKQRLKKLQCFTEIVSVNGRPFSYLMDSGFQKTIEDDMKKLADAGHKITFSNNFEEIKEYMRHVSTEIRSKIKAEVYGKPVSLCADITTKNRRAILGITVQYIHDGKLRIRSIGMINLNTSHTGAYLKSVIEEVLEVYGIRIEQVISMTTDNGSNMLKMIKMFNRSSTDSSDDDDEIDYEEISPEEENAADIGDFSEQEVEALMKEIEYETLLNEELSDEDIYRQLLVDLTNEFSDVEFDVSGIRCAAHTLQLAVIGALKKSNVLKWIQLCRKVAKIIRTQNLQYMIKSQNIGEKYVRLDCITRWNSTFLMVNIHKRNFNFI